MPVPYGRVVPRLFTEQEDEEMGDLRDYHNEKKKGVALLASNCGGKSGRYNYLDK